MDKRYIYVLLFVVGSIPFFVPMVLPLPITEMTSKYNDFIESIPDGSIVAFNVQIYRSTWPMLGSGSAVTTTRLFEKDCRIVFFTMSASGVPMIDFNVQEAFKINPKLSDKVYGADWVDLGFVSGDESGLAAFLTNIPGVLPTDSNGTPLEDIPIMKGIKTGGDIKYVINAAGSVSSPPLYFQRQWVAKYGVKLGLIAVKSTGPQVTPFIEAGEMQGALIGTGGCAEYEALTQKPGPALSLTNAGSITIIFLMLLMVASNINYYRGRK